MSVTIYGLPNCDSTKAAIKYFKQQKIDFSLHDLKVDAVSKSKLQSWLKLVPLEKLLNKKSTTWRSLEKWEQDKASTEEGATELMCTHTNLIKRPVIEKDGQLESVGVIPGAAKK